MIETAPETTASASRIGLVRERLMQTADIFREAASSVMANRIEEAASSITKAFGLGRKLLVFGNGGSASDAQHLCGELVVRFQMSRRPLPAIALCCDAAVMTACGNDFSYDQVFERQIEALGQTGDVALGISTSGNSINVVKGLQAARNKGLSTILMTGPQPGRAGAFSDIVLAAPGPNTARIQELHLASYHAICELVESHFFGEGA
jgi:D-sedoheptulose 7-phosphate isomerase